MYRCRTLTSRSTWLAAVTWLAVTAIVWGQRPPLVPPVPITAPAKVSTTSAAQALALDQKLIAEAKNGSEIMANLTYLSDIIGPRLTGSTALKHANEWTADKMRSYGLANVHLEAYTIPMGWERGSATGRIIEPNNGRTLSLAATGWSPGTNGKIEGDVVVLTARTSSEMAALKGKLKNAIVLRGPPANVRPITDTGCRAAGMGRSQGPAVHRASGRLANRWASGAS